LTLKSLDADAILRELESESSLVIVDALPPMSYAHSHLPGAINLPPERVDATVRKRLPDVDVPIVVYCANPTCEDSHVTAERLVGLGYTNVRHYPGGKDEWRERGLPLERAGKPYDASASRR
jgi:rhodanese-related sulfurtransferase